MQENVGTLDRRLRAVLGPSLMGLGLSLWGRGHDWLGPAALVVGTIITETVVTRVCPVNATLGIDTREDRTPIDISAIGATPPIIS